MKKLILFLLLPLWAMAQTATGQEQEFDYGIKNNSTQTITTPPYLGTFGTDGTQGKIPSAYIEKTDNKQNSLAIDGTGTKYPTVDAVNAALPKTYTTTVYVNTNDPNTATVFDDENPPTVNDDGLKSNTDNLYIGADASAWVYSGGEYVTKIVPASSNFNLYSTSIDAGNDKYSTIERFGEIVSKSGNIVRKDGSDSVGGGGYFSFYNNAITSGNTFQLNASNGVDLWNYSSGTWNKRFTFSSDGGLTANSFIKSGGTSSQFLKADGSVDSTQYQPTLVSGTNIKTLNGTSLLGSGDITISGGGGDMVLASSQTVSGLKTFLSGMFGLRNVANTFTSFFTNANTASRTYTLQNRDGTLADLTDIAGVNSGKMNTPSGTTNYLSKFLTATTIGLSRLWDTGAFLGIGTVNTPTKDITLGNDGNKEIGIEQSNSTTKGRDLIVSAGKTINYVDNSNFISLNQTKADYQGIMSDGSDIYVASQSSGIYKQTAGVGSFVNIDSSNTYDIAVLANGDMYNVDYLGVIRKKTGGLGSFVVYQTIPGNAIHSMWIRGNDIYVAKQGGDIYKQTNGTGSFVALGQTARNWAGGCSHPNGNVYATVSNGDIYMQTNGTGSFVALGQTVRNWSDIGSHSNGNVYATVYGGDIYMQTNGTGSFVALGQTARNWAGITVNSSGYIYATTAGADGNIFILNTNAVGNPNLDGGILKLKAGTGKGTGVSKIQLSTGAKTTSGTDMQLETVRMEIDENGRTYFYSSVNLKNYTVATLPTGVQGDTAYVTDALAPTYMATVVGGGTVVCPVFFNGTAWVAH